MRQGRLRRLPRGAGLRELTRFENDIEQAGVVEALGQFRRHGHEHGLRRARLRRIESEAAERRMPPTGH